jgi:uncharacterized protein (DUF1778 family)
MFIELPKGCQGMTEPRKPITIRVNLAEHAAMKRAASEIGLTLSAWLRMTALKEAKRTSCA